MSGMQEQRKDEDEVIIQSYLSDLNFSDSYQDSFAELVEQIPNLLYPLDFAFSSAILEQKAKLLKSYGIIHTMRLEMDKEGIQLPPSYQRGINAHLLFSGKLLFQLSQFRKCRHRLNDATKNFKEELAAIRSLPYELMDMDACQRELAHIQDYIRRVSYCKYENAYFPSILLKKICKHYLNKINFTYSENDLLLDLPDRYSSASKAIFQFAEEFRQIPGLCDAVNAGVSFSILCKEYPRIELALCEFLEKYGFISQNRFCCVGVESYYENPLLFLQHIQKAWEHPFSEESKALFQSRIREAKQRLSSRTYASFEQKIKYLRYFSVASSELEYLCETAFYYARKIFSRISLLTVQNPNLLQNFAFLFLEEVYKVCQNGFLLEEDRKKIYQRQQKRPLATKIWETTKNELLSDSI